MLQKFKSLLKFGPLPPHPASSEASQELPQCPFSKQQGQKQAPNSMKCPVTGKSVEADSDSEEEEKPRGGCPFMSGSSQKKKNPDLKQNEQGYNEPFVSKFRYYLSTSKINFANVKRGLPQPTISREIFDTYPIYLQHTLFYNGEDYQKVRSLQCCSRFMAYEQLREKGNKKFNKGKYYEAIEFYERSLSLFKWLEYAEPTNQSTISSENLSAEENSFSQTSQTGSKVNIPLDEENIEDPDNTFDELKTKYKEFFITYTDDNTKLCDGEQLTEEADIDMRKSLMIQVFLNLSAAYINIHHYSLAVKVCDEGIALSDKVSQLYFRKAQAIALNKSSNLDELKQAQYCIKLAIERRSGEKIFASANQNILKMLNIHDSEEAYQQCSCIVNKKLEQCEKSAQENMMKVYDRVKQIYKNQQRIISEGKVPTEGRHKKMNETTEMKILNRMTSKYIKVVEFYTESKNAEQVTLAKRQFQEILRINKEVNSILAVQLEEKDNELGGLHQEKVQRRLDYVKTQFAEEIYNNGKFNFTMLEWAIKEIVKEEKAEQDAKKKAEEEALKEQMGNEGQIETKSSKSNLLYLLIIVPLIIMLLNMFIL